VREEDHTIVINLKGQEVYIDKTSDRYLSMYKEDMDFVLDPPSAVEYKDKRVNLRKRSTFQDLKKAYQGLEGYKKIVFKHKVLQDYKLSEKVKKEFKDFLAS